MIQRFERAGRPLNTKIHGPAKNQQTTCGCLSSVAGLQAKKEADRKTYQLAFSIERLATSVKQRNLYNKCHCNEKPNKAKQSSLLTVTHLTQAFSNSNKAFPGVLFHISSIRLCRVRTRDTVSINYADQRSSSKHS